MDLAVLPQQARLDEFGPGHRRMAALGLDADHRLVQSATTLATFQPVVERPLRYAEQAGCGSLGEHLPVPHSYAHDVSLPSLQRTDRAVASHVGSSRPQVG